MKASYDKLQKINEIIALAGKYSIEDIAKKTNLTMYQVKNLAFKNKIPLIRERSLKNPILPGKKFGRLTVIKWLDYSLRPNGKGQKMSRYLCQCDCNINSQVIVFSPQLKNGFTQSCGCLKEESDIKAGKKIGEQYNNKLPSGESAIRNLLKAYEKGARYRGLNFYLDRELFEKLIFGNCFYCGIEPNRQHPTKSVVGMNGTIIVNGIDRLDSDKDYTTQNCVSCCSICNKAKRDMKLSDFLNWIQILTKHQNFKMNG